MSAASVKTCPYCAEEIKADALKCKHCGSMLSDKPVVIEKTSKRYKQQMLNGIYLSVGSIVVMFLIGVVSQGSDNPIVGIVGALCLLGFVGGIGWVLVARISAWWHHG